MAQPTGRSSSVPVSGKRSVPSAQPRSIATGWTRADSPAANSASANGASPNSMRACAQQEQKPCRQRRTHQASCVYALQGKRACCGLLPLHALEPASLTWSPPPVAVDLRARPGGAAWLPSGRMARAAAPCRAFLRRPCAARRAACPQGWAGGTLPRRHPLPCTAIRAVPAGVLRPSAASQGCLAPASAPFKAGSLSPSALASPSAPFKCATGVPVRVPHLRTSQGCLCNRRPRFLRRAPMGNLVPFPALQGYLAQTSYPMPFQVRDGAYLWGVFAPFADSPRLSSARRPRFLRRHP